MGRKFKPNITIKLCSRVSRAGRPPASGAAYLGVKIPGRPVCQLEKCLKKHISAHLAKGEKEEEVVAHILVGGL